MKLYFLIFLIVINYSWAQRLGINITLNKSGGLDLLEANESLDNSHDVYISESKSKRIIRSNGIPNHKVGKFPNFGNPNKITANVHKYEVPIIPSFNPVNTQLTKEMNFGIALNGIVFDPSGTDSYLNSNSKTWQYEPLSGAINLGVDANHAYVERDGSYRYIGLPTMFLKQKKIVKGFHSPLIGYAADGYPIYALYGVNGKSMRSSYKLRSGVRPTENDQPGGKFDGTFVGDYEYVLGAGELDECNGAQTKSQDYPNGTYAYFLSEKWPVIPRCFKGEPDRSFMKTFLKAENKEVVKVKNENSKDELFKKSVKACVGKIPGDSCMYRGKNKKELRGRCYREPRGKDIFCELK